MHRQLWKKLSKKQKGDGAVPEEATLHLNLHLYVHLFHHLSVIVHLLHAERFWKQQENPRRRPSFGQTPLFALFGGQNKLGVDTAVLGDGQSQTLPSRSEGDSG